MGRKENFAWEAAAELYQGMSRKNQIISKKAFFFGDYKFITSDNGADELFNLREDEVEMNNLIGTDQENEEKGKRIAESFVTVLKEEEMPVVSEQLTPEELKQLKALGYMK